MVQYITVNGKNLEIADMAGEYKYGLMVVDMKVIGQKIRPISKES